MTLIKAEQFAGRWEVRARSLDYSGAMPFALGATAAIGVLVAYAPILPYPVRSPLLLAGLGAWATAVLVCAALAAAAAWRGLRDRDGKGFLLLGAVGIGLALLASVQVELIQTLLGRPGFTWSWRWDLGHAQAIARTGGLGQALDYAGAPIQYHVGAAWLAAAMQRMTGHGLTHVLFGLVPLLSVLSLVIGGLTLLHAAGLRYRIAAVALALAVTIPVHDLTPWGVYYALLELPSSLDMSQTWPLLGTKLMLNSLFGLAIGTTSLALLLSRQAGAARLVAATFGLASLTQIKPQYYAAFAFLAGVVGLARAFGIGNGGARDARVLVVALASLALALAHLSVLPGDVSWFAMPQWRTSGNRGLFYEPLRAFTSVILVGLLAWYLVYRRGSGRGSRPASLELLLAGAATVFALGGIFYLFEFPFRSEFVARWYALGFERLGHALAGDKDLAQGLQAPRLLVLAAGFGILAACAQQAGVWWRRAFALVAAAIVLTPVRLLALGFVNPPKYYAVAEDEDLRQTLAQIPRQGTLLISSDLADPAQDHLRPLQGMLLTAYGGHTFYIANLRYVHYTKDDVVTRLREMQSFFGTPWSEWHTAWLAHRGITHVLADDRCRPVWLGQQGLPLTPLGSHGRWMSFAVARSSGSAQLARPPQPMGLQPAYGIADCLSGRRVAPATQDDG